MMMTSKLNCGGHGAPPGWAKWKRNRSGVGRCNQVMLDTARSVPANWISPVVLVAKLSAAERVGPKGRVVATDIRQPC